MRPASLPPAEQYAHGTRARYVAGCRCPECRASNTRAYHERQSRALALAAEIVAAPAPAPQAWTAPDGSKRTRVYRRACPGIPGQACPNHSHLRKDSKGGVCGRCRGLLVWNGNVSADRARGHLEALSALGVGYKAAADACGVAKSTLFKVISGTKRVLRRSTAERILEVDPSAIADSAIIDGRPTLALIRQLRAWGLSKAEIARRLGMKAPALQLRRRVLARSALAVERLHRAVVAERAARPTCEDCALWAECRGRRLGRPSCVLAEVANAAA